MSSFSASKQVVKPPQRGIFPLDHDSECRTAMKLYLECLSTNSNDHYKCSQYSKDYLQCRMDHQLMAKEDLTKLGFAEDNKVKEAKSVEGQKEAQGYTAGKHIDQKRKWFWQQ